MGGQEWGEGWHVAALGMDGSRAVSYWGATDAPSGTLVCGSNGSQRQREHVQRTEVLTVLRQWVATCMISE